MSPFCDNEDLDSLPLERIKVKQTAAIDLMLSAIM
jgi:hypothetical protein